MLRAFRAPLLVVARLEPRLQRGTPYRYVGDCAPADGASSDTMTRIVTLRNANLMIINFSSQ